MEKCFEDPALDSQTFFWGWELKKHVLEIKREVIQID